KRKPPAKSRSENWPTLNVQCARNSLSQCLTPAPSAANLRKSRHNFAVLIFSCNINDFVAEREGFEPPIGLHLCRISSAVHSTTLPPLLKAPYRGRAPVVGGVHKRGWRDRQGAKGENRVGVFARRVWRRVRRSELMRFLAAHEQLAPFAGLPLSLELDGMRLAERADG